MGTKKINGTAREWYDTVTKIVYEIMDDGIMNPIRIFGARMVTPAFGGIPTEVAGISQGVVLTASDADPNATGYPAYIDAIAAKAVTFQSLGFALAANDAIICYCSTDPDPVAAAAVVNAYHAKLAAPGTVYPPSHPNVKLITLYDPVQRFQYDGTTLMQIAMVRRLPGAGNNFTVPCEIGV